MNRGLLISIFVFFTMRIYAGQIDIVSVNYSGFQYDESTTVEVDVRVEDYTDNETCQLWVVPNELSAWSSGYPTIVNPILFPVGPENNGTIVQVGFSISPTLAGSRSIQELLIRVDGEDLFNMDYYEMRAIIDVPFSIADFDENAQEEVAEKFLPILRMDNGVQLEADWPGASVGEEVFVPKAIDMLMSNSDWIMEKQDNAPDVNVLPATIGNLSIACSSKNYIHFNEDDSDPQGLIDWYEENEGSNNTQLYASFCEENDFVVLTYWIYYIYNNNEGWGVWGALTNHHISEWEGLCLVFTKDSIVDNYSEAIPVAAATSSHLGSWMGKKRLWKNVEKIGDHPVIYVCNGSHASYFHRGHSANQALDLRDYHYGDGQWVVPQDVSTSEIMDFCFIYGYGISERTEYGSPQVSVLPRLVNSSGITWHRFGGLWGQSDQSQRVESPSPSSPCFIESDHTNEYPPDNDTSGFKWFKPYTWFEQQETDDNLSLLVDFTTSQSSGEAPFNTSFHDASSELANQWLWAFGDGTFSSSQNPLHTYTAPGTYTVSLTVSDGVESVTMTKADFIEVSEPAPQNFAISGQVTTTSANPISGVTVSTNDGTSDTTDNNGNYALTVSSGWSGTITPSYNDYSFNPSSIGIVDVSANIGNQNFQGYSTSSQFRPPSNVSCTNTGLLSWDAPSGGYIYVPNYYIYLNGSHVGTTGENGRSYQFNNLNDGQSYTVGVRAHYAQGESEIITCQIIYQGGGVGDPLVTWDCSYESGWDGWSCIPGCDPWWERQGSDHAGGSNGELACHNPDGQTFFTGETGVYSPYFNTNGYGMLRVQFRFKFMYYNGAPDLVLYTKRGSFNLREAERVDLNQDIGPTIWSFDIDTRDIGSSDNIRLALKIDANGMNSLNAYFDDFVISPIYVPTVPVTVQLNCPNGDATDFEVELDEYGAGDIYEGIPNSSGVVQFPEVEIGEYDLEVTWSDGTLVYDENVGDITGSTTLNATVYALVPPETVQASVQNSNDVLLTWSSVRDTYTPHSYKIYREGTLIHQTSSGNIFSFLDQDLAEGTYTYTVATLYSNGNNTIESSASNPVFVTISNTFIAPSYCSAINQNYNDVSVTWSMSRRQIGHFSPSRRLTRDPMLQGYRVLRDDVVVHEIYDTQTLNWIDTNVSNGNHTYFVEAVYDEGVSGPSPTSSVTINLTSPSDVICTIEGELTWTAPSSTRGLTGYRILLDQNQVTTLGSGVTSYTYTGLDESVQHEAGVVAIYGNNNESDAATCTFVYYMPPKAPENLLISIENDTAMLNWDPVTETIGGALITPDGYNILTGVEPEQSTHSQYAYTAANSFRDTLTSIRNDARYYSIITKFTGQGSVSGGLVARYPLNGSGEETTGNAVDGIEYGDPQPECDRFGNAGNAILFDGGDDYIDLGNGALPNESSFSVSVWYKTASLSSSTHEFIYGISDDTGGEFRLKFPNSDVLYADIRGTAGDPRISTQTSTDLYDNSWHLAVVSWNNTTQELALNVDNGAYIETNSGTLSGVFSTSSPLYLGISSYNGNSVYNNYYFSGSLDDLRIYNRDLGSSEINSLYSEGGWPNVTSVIADYPFNNNANDESGSGHNGTVTGATPASDRFSNPESAYSFDGSDDIITVGDSPELDLTGDYCISAWFKMSGTRNNHRLLNKDADNDYSNGWALLYNGPTNALTFCHYPESGDVSNHVTILADVSSDTWYHVAVSYDQPDLMCYIDGSLVAQFTMSSPIGANTEPLEIGGSVDYNQYFAGVLDDIQLFNGSLSESEIQTLYSEGGWTNVPNSDMILIPSGSFQMGNTLGGGESDELPVHNVQLDAFFIGEYEVSQQEWVSIMGNNPASVYGVGDFYPIYNINWYAILKYCNLCSLNDNLTPVYSINGTTDPSSWGSVPTSSNSTWDAVTCNWNANGYRLPTEAEWEYAARGAQNTPDYIYAGSNSIGEVAWYTGNSGNLTHPAGDDLNPVMYSEGGAVYNLSGNIWEWCWDWYGAYSSEQQDNPTGPINGSGRIHRGGAFWSDSGNCRLTKRYGGSPYETYTNIGFRLARNAN